MAGNPAGNAITNEIMYMANMFGRGRMPYGGAFQGVTGALQGAANFLNRNQIGTRGLPAQRPPMPGLPTNYKQTELATGAAAEAFRPGAGFPGQQGAAERAYQQEKSRIAQQTAQDPELQRYEAARLKAVAPGATAEQVQSAEDIGMQIWRQKYGTTPMGQTGGAVGSFNPLMQKTFGYQSGMAPNQLAEMQKTAAPIPVAPGALPYQMGDLGTRVSETGYDPAAYGLTPDKIEEMKKKLLQQASK
jgi:hypothetical protein